VSWSIVLRRSHGDAELLLEVVLLAAAPGAVVGTGSTCGSIRWVGEWVSDVLSISSDPLGNVPVMKVWPYMGMSTAPHAPRAVGESEPLAYSCGERTLSPPSRSEYPVVLKLGSQKLEEDKRRLQMPQVAACKQPTSGGAPQASKMQRHAFV